MAEVSEANIPAAAMVALPAVHVAGRILEGGAPGAGVAVEGAVLRAGRYLAATADIGLFEHTLSTDLLNHLVFVQKVFMKVGVILIPLSVISAREWYSSSSCTCAGSERGRAEGIRRGEASAAVERGGSRLAVLPGSIFAAHPHQGRRSVTFIYLGFEFACEIL